MSGFAGMVRLDGSAPEDRKTIERMAAGLAFRGPDATQVWSDERANFCFTLLRTGPAPQAEAQPVSLEGRAWLLGEVRLDARADLIRKLSEHGARCSKATSDEELVLLAWQTWGETAGEKFRETLRGELSFALWLPEQRKVLCFRDLMGCRPFFYFQAESTLCFSNTLETVLGLSDVSCELDSRYIGDFLLGTWPTDTERTAYRDVRRLPGGHELVFAGRGAQARRFDDLPIEEPLHLKRPGDYVEQYRAILTDCVKERLPAGATAIFLSGGLDSSTVAATAARILRGNASGGVLYAHTEDCRPLFDDQEGIYASKVAQHLGIPIEIFHEGDWAPFSGWENVAELRFPEPADDPFVLASAEFYRCVARHARVALSGDGGDDILGGKAWPYVLYLLRRMELGNLVSSFGGYVLRRRKIPPLGTGLLAGVRKLLGTSQNGDAYPNWVNPEFEKSCDLRRRWRELQVKEKPVHPMHARAHWGLRGSYWPRILEQEDAGWTGVPVEYRSPMLDARVLQFLLRVPPVPFCADKELLRLSAEGVLPGEIQWRAKAPLQRDPLEVYIAERGWSPRPPAVPSPRIHQFVDWKKWSASISNLSSTGAWNQLCPLSLHLWLERIEKSAEIR